MTGQGSSQVQPVISTHQLDVLVVAVFGGLVVVFVLVMVATLVGQLLAARGRAQSRPAMRAVRGGRR